MLETETTENVVKMFEEELRSCGIDEFLYTGEAFKLYDEVSRSYPALTAELKLLLEQRGKRLGLKTAFVREKLKRYESMDPSAYLETVSAWEGQPFPVNVGNYILNGEEIREQSGMVTLPVCSHPIMPTRRYLDIETGEESIELSFKLDNVWKTVIVSKSTLSDASKIVPLSGKGIYVTSENSRALVRFLTSVDKKNRDRIPKERISSHVGWVNDHEFVPYAPGISYGGMESFRQMFDSIGTHGDPETWLNTVRSVRKEAGSVPARIALAASFASPLCIKFGALPFIVHLWSARSGSGKTVTLELAASVWAKPDVGDYVKSMKATTVAIEQLAVFCRHLPLCLDELQTIQTQDRFDEFIYMLCEGHGKERGAKNGGLRSVSSWRNTTITTGEMPMIGSASKAGSINRVIEIEGMTDMLEDPRKVVSIIQQHYGWAGKAFIEAMPGAMDEARKQFELFESELVRKCTAKQALSAAMLMLGDWLSEKLIFKDGITLRVEDLQPYLKTDQDVDTNRRAHEWILGWVSESYTSFVREVTGGEDIPENGYKAIGRIERRRDDTRIAWINQKICREALTGAGYNYKSYFSWARARGLLARKEQKGNEFTPVVDLRSGNKVRCIGILIDKSDDKQEMTLVQHDPEMPWDEQ